MHNPIGRLAHTTAFVTPVVEHWLERDIAQWVHPMKDRSDDPSHHVRTLLPRSYISRPSKDEVTVCKSDCYNKQHTFDDTIIGQQKRKWYPSNVQQLVHRTVREASVQCQSQATAQPVPSSIAISRSSQ